MLSRLTDALLVCWQALAVAIARPRSRRATGADEKHLLIVSFDFPPGTVTGGQLPAFLARHASRNGWRVTVVCGPAAPDPTPRGLAALGLVPEKVRIVRAPGRLELGEYHPQLPYKLSPKIDGGFSQGVGMAYAGVQHLGDHPPTHVFATGPTFVNFLVGRRLAAHYGASLALQYRDEWTVMQPSFVAHSDRARNDEERSLASADLVTFVTQGKADLYRESFPLLAGKRILVASNGWDPDITAGASDTSSHFSAFSGKLILAFTGRVTEEIPIAPFLALLADVLDQDPELRASLILSVTGDQTGITALQLQHFRGRHPDSLDVRAGVSQVTVTEMLSEASALLLLNNTRYRGVVPLKTFDYMVSRSPILAFGTVGEAGSIVEQTGAGVTVDSSDAESLRAALHRLRTTDRASWQTPARQEWLDRNNRERVCDVLLSELSALPRRS